MAGEIVKRKAEALVLPEEEGDHFDALVEDCRAIVDQAIFASKMRLVEGMHALGKRIVKDPLFKKHAKGNQAFLQTLASAVRRNVSEIYRAVAFAQAFPAIKDAVSKIPDGKNLSWTAVKRYLGTGDEDPCEHEKTVKLTVILKKCRVCGKVLSKELAEP